MLALIIAVMGLIAGALLLAVVFAPIEKHDANVTVQGRPLAIEAPSLARPRDVEVRPRWDAVDTHWGETQWMMHG